MHDIHLKVFSNSAELLLKGKEREFRRRVSENEFFIENRRLRNPRNFCRSLLINTILDKSDNSTVIELFFLQSIYMFLGKIIQNCRASLS